jgi:hypothetical protein
MIFSRRVVLIAGIVVFNFCVSSSGQDQPRRLLEYPLPFVREEQSVTIDGTEEIWRLKWNSEPKPFCQMVEVPPTCPCDGFAYGESGDLDLVRLRRGAEIDRLNLTPIFKGAEGVTEDETAVQRVAQLEDDWNQSPESLKLNSRRVVQVMHLGDYNHDGLATEFFLQTDAEPCGKHYGVVLGITKDNPRLHPFGTVAHPDIPLSMESDAWETLRTATAPVKIIDWHCEDHGSDEQAEFELTWSPRGIDGVRRTYACAANVRGKLLSEAPL